MEEIGAVESMDKLSSLRITSLDDDDDIHDDEELQDDYDTDEDEEMNESVVLGFVTNPKNSWSLLPQLFPSKAGGVPVCKHNPHPYHSNFSFILYVFINFLCELECCLW